MKLFQRIVYMAVICELFFISCSLLFENKNDNKLDIKNLNKVTEAIGSPSEELKITSETIPSKDEKSNKTDIKNLNNITKETSATPEEPSSTSKEPQTSSSKSESKMPIQEEVKLFSEKIPDPENNCEFYGFDSSFNIGDKIVLKDEDGNCFGAGFVKVSGQFGLLTAKGGASENGNKEGFKEEETVYFYVNDIKMPYVGTWRKGRIEKLYKNCPPVISPIGDKSVEINNSLIFAVSAYDLDADHVDLTIENLPEGASFDSSMYIFNWKPTEAQVGTYEVRFKADDNINNPVCQKIIINVGKNCQFYSIDPNLNIGDKISLKDDIGNEFGVGVVEIKGQFGLISAAGDISSTTTKEGFNEGEAVYLYVNGAKTAYKAIWHEKERVSFNGNAKPIIHSIANQKVKTNNLVWFYVGIEDWDHDYGKCIAKNLPEGAKFDSTQNHFEWTPTVRTNKGQRPISIDILSSL